MDTLAIWVQALLGAIFLVSTAANSLALLVFCRRPGLRTISNRFVINLLAANVLTTCVLAPLAAYELAVSQTLGTNNTEPLATATDALAATLSLGALLGVLLIAADQHHAVTDPLRCHARLLQRRPAALVASAWLAAALAGALCAALRKVPQETAKYLSQIVYATLYLFAGVIVPAVAVCVVYARIYNAARSSGLRARAHGTSALQLHDAMPALPDLVEEGEGLTLRIDVNSKDRKFGPFLVPPAPRRCPSAASLRAFVQPRRTPPSRELGSTEDVRRLPAVSSAPALAGAPLLQPLPPLAPVSRVSSLRCRISNASLFRYREESRAARVGASACALALLHAPHAVLSLVRAIDGQSHIADIHRTAALALVCLAAAASPFLFALRSRRVQREARRLFRPQEKAPAVRPPPAAPEQARAALELLRALTPGPHTGRSSFSSGASTQLSSASDE